jgi:hypothetical protein
MKNRAKEILTKLDKEEIIALAYGFPLPEEKFYESFVDDNNSLVYTTEVDGDWQPLEMNSTFDGFEFADEYDNFLTKKSRERRKRKKQLRKEEGLSRKEARQQAREEIPPTTLKEVAKKVGGGIKRGFMVGALAVPRASFLSLIAINFRGFGWKLSNIINKRNGTPASVERELKAKWDKLGGKWGKLVKAINSGAKKKKPFFCGKKCKKKLVEAGAKRNFANFNSSELDFDPYFNSAGGIDLAVVGTWVGLGTGVIGATAPIINKAIENKREKEAIANEKAIAEQSLANMSEQEKREVALAEQKLKLEADPKNVILQNPNLSAEEKALALKQLDEATSTQDTRNLKKYALLGGLGLVGIFLLYKMFKSK